MDARLLCLLDVLIYVLITPLKSYFGTSIEHNTRTSIGRRVIAEELGSTLELWYTAYTNVQTR